MQPTDHPRRYRGVSAERRREERRQRLIEAGLEIFGTTGYRAATVDAVCVRAGLTKRYFYESFTSSEELLLAAYAEATGRLRRSVMRALAQSGTATRDPSDMARAGLEAVFRFLHDNRPLARLIFVEVLGVSPAVDRAYQTLMEDWAQLLVGLVPEHPYPRLDLLAAGVVGAVIGLAMRWIIADYADSVADVVAAANALLNGVLLPVAVPPTRP